jgi:hypothetical protein
MASLHLTEIKCIEETDDWGNDSPYLVVFVGNSVQGLASSQLRSIRRSTWDNEFETGTKKTFDLSVSDDVNATSLVLCAMLEEDYAPDLVKSEERFGWLRQWMTDKWAFLGPLQEVSLNQKGSLMLNEFWGFLNTLVTNDEVIHVQRLIVAPTVPSTYEIHFEGHGGHYRTKWKTE